LHLHCVSAQWVFWIVNPSRNSEGGFALNHLLYEFPHSFSKLSTVRNNDNSDHCNTINLVEKLLLIQLLYTASSLNTSAIEKEFGEQKTRIRG
jgi:hypothetical protein